MCALPSPVPQPPSLSDEHAVCCARGPPQRSARNNVNVLSSSVVVSVGMGPGTASEVALAIKAGKHTVLLQVSQRPPSFQAVPSRTGCRSACAPSPTSHQVHARAQAGEEAAKFFSSLKPSHVHVAKDVAAALTHIKAVLAA